MEPVSYRVDADSLIKHLYMKKQNGVDLVDDVAGVVLRNGLDIRI